jgi:hypothetical protein
MTLSRRLAALLTLAVLSAAPTANAQQPPPPAPNPAAPTLNPVLPLGAQRGTAPDLTLTGTNLADPVALWTNIPGAKATIPTDANNGKEPTKLRVKLDVPKDAPLGLYAVRLATARGMSNLRLFCVDDLPPVNAEPAARKKETAQAVPVPSVVVGKADPEQTDYFKVAVKAGQRLSFEVLGRRLGSAFDPQLSVVDARTGREVAYSNDSPGLQSDARLTHTFKEAGDYLVEVRDVTFRGGPDFSYRLRIGDFPCATTPVPMAAKRGSKVAVRFAGPNVEGVAPVEVTVPTDPAVSVVQVAPKGAGGLSGWPVSLFVSDLDELVEQEPNNEPAKANRLPVPCGVTGRFEQKGDIDHFVFAAKKGQRYVIDAQTLDYHSPTEVYMVLKDAKGGQVAASNPAAGQRIDYTAAADGDYTLSVEHLHYWGGPAETYHLTVTPYEPGFDLSIALDRWDVAQGGTLSLPIIATRRDYTGPIEVSVSGHAGVSGTLTIPAAAGPPTPPNVPAGNLLVSVKPDVPVGPLVLTVHGKATINGKPLVTTANVANAVKAELAGLPYPPRQLLDGLAVAVTPKPPFALTAKVDAGGALRGVAATVTVTAARDAGFDAEITLAPGALPPNVAAALKPIPKGANEVKVTLTPAANAALGSAPFTFIGRAKFNGQDVAGTSAPTPLVVSLPFELKAEPSPLKLLPGGKAVLKVTATRKGGYAGPIALEVRNLPANVTAAKVTIAMGQSSADVEVTAAANAAAGDKADVNVLGTATAAANQAAATPNITVSVGKK